MTPDPAPRLILPASGRDVLRAAAEAAYPNEFCALLVGVDEGAASRVTRVVPAANIHPEPRTGFELDPRVLIGVLRDLREAGRDAGQSGGQRLLGHCHSHPDGAARPSARDQALAHEPGLFWLVAAVRRGRLEALNGFRVVAEGVFVPAAIETP